MRINLSRRFKNNFEKRILPGSSLDQKYQQRVGLFIGDRQNPILKDHQLSGRMRSYRAFSISGDVRVVYFLESDDEVTFVDIGTHNQVYN